MSSGHMVEVKLDRQHAVLYYVHKRPYCDEFLRKVGFSLSRDPFLRVVPFTHSLTHSLALKKRSPSGTTWWCLRRQCKNMQTLS